MPAVTISTIAAQRDLINLALLAILTPIAVGLLLQVEALGGFQAGHCVRPAAGGVHVQHRRRLGQRQEA
jgi:Na+/H+-translocating membrane pyrophosphatase